MSAILRQTLTIAALLGVANAPAKTPSVNLNGLSASVANLVDQDGHRFDARSIRGKVVLVNFIFTGCGSTCPTQTIELARFERSLPPAVRAKLRIVSISVDPTNDTPKVLRTYAKTFGIDAGRWQFLTGSLPDILKVTQRFAAMRPDQATSGFHTSELRVFDANSRMVQRYSGAPLADAQLRSDLMTLTGTRG